MKENRKFLISAVVTLLVSFVGIVCCELFFQNEACLVWKEIIKNINIGLLSSSILAIPTAIIGYNIEKKRVKNLLFTQLSLLRLKIKNILVDYTKDNINGCNMIEISLGRDFKDQLTSLDTVAISVVQCLHDIPIRCNLSSLVKDISGVCSGINILTEEMQNIVGGSGKTMETGFISQNLDIGKLNQIISKLKKL